jgi:hypothetical protein
MTRTRMFALAALAFLALPWASARADFYVAYGRPRPYYYRHSYYRPYVPFGVYVAPPAVYVAPRPVYVTPAPVYVQPAPTYLQAAPVAPPQYVPVPVPPSGS